MSELWNRWVRFWAAVEGPESLALVRILLSLVILFDFVEIGRLGLVVEVFGAQEVGGLGDPVGGAAVSLAYQVLPATVGTAFLLYGLTTLSAAIFAAGLFTRFSALALLFCWSQQVDILPASDRGIDMLCRNVLMIFAFAESGACYSLDAWFRTGKWRGNGSLIPAWPRRLLIVQIVAMYFLAGVQKTGIHWYAPGHFAALYFFLQEPGHARFDFAFLENQPWFFFTQVGTLGTILLQDSYPLVLLWSYYRRTPERPGWLRAFANRWRLELWWIGLGALFHLMLAVSMELGIFPWAMLALYPAWFSPDATRAGLDRVMGRLGGKRS